MSFLKKSISVLAVFAAIPAAFAVTARPSVTGATAAASRRLPALSAYLTTGTSGTTDSSTSMMTDIECVDAYTGCMKANDVCGPEFEECTNKNLFHGQMPKCLNVLSQCKSTGIKKLFGADSVSALGSIKSKDATTGKIEYTYPTDKSDMGMWIAAAYENNLYDTTTCVKRYTSCLQRDSVCGMDFELCTGNTEFKKQALLCDSTLARCQGAGIYELFGAYSWTTSSPTIGGRVATMIDEGAKLAALNAVATCNKVVDQCFLAACSANPVRCTEGSTIEMIQAANLTGEEIEFGGFFDKDGDETISKTEINRYLRTACLDTIGSNKYCHMTYLENVPSKKDLQDPDLQEEVFAMAVDQRKSHVDSKIKDLMTAFDKEVKDKCVETIRSCAMRTCGEGIGSVCYASVFSTDGQDSINGSKTYADIERGCAAIVNTDSNCQYAATSLNNDNKYSYSYVKDDVFSTLFPKYSDAKLDPIGVVASLNSSLATNYNDAAIASMEKRCKNVATNCVKSVCGTDYVNCYRNRTDIVADLTKTGTAGFDKSMNKVGGVLDYTIVLGMCMNTVKNSEVCSEHLKITRARYLNDDSTTDSWDRYDSVRDAWVDAGGAKKLEGIAVDSVQKVDENEKLICTNANGTECVCDELEEGLPCETPVFVTRAAYQEQQSVNTLFKELITDLEHEAQSIYNIKLTKQQNMCQSMNQNMGVLGPNDAGSTYDWVKLRGNKIPTGYSTSGLSPKDFVHSNDLYGSFCRIRVTLQSDDPKIQDALKDADWATTYFAAGDAYTCGSWIGSDELETLATAAAEDARDAKKKELKKLSNWYWTLPAVMAATGVGGSYLGAGLADGSIGGKLSGLNKASTTQMTTYKTQCKTGAENAITALESSPINYDTAATYASYAVNAAENLTTVDSSNADTALGEYNNAIACHEAMTAWLDTVIPGSAPNGDDSKRNIKDSYCGNRMTTLDASQARLTSAADTLTANLEVLKGYCEAADEDESVEASDKNKKKNAAMGVGITSSLIGAGLTIGVIETVRNTKLNEAEQAAYDEFYETLGKHLHCYIGGEPAGDFGDTVVTSLE